MNELLIILPALLLLLMFSRSGPTAPPPPPPAPVIAEEDTEEYKAAEIKRLRMAKGRESTMLTGGQGVTGELQVNKNSILGR